MAVYKPDKSYDVLIIGAGPSGTTLGYLLSELGIRALVIDRMKFPRLKLCGGAITWKTRQIVEDIFKVSFDEKFVVKNISQEYFVYEKFNLKISQKSPQPFYFINRQEYDRELTVLAEKKSCLFLFGHRVVDIDLTNNTVLTKSGKCLRGEVVVGADGALSIIRKKLFHHDEFKKNMALAFQTSVAMENVRKEYQGLTPKLFLGSLRCGYGWLFPHQDSCVLGVAGLLRKNSRIEQKYINFLLKTTTLKLEQILPLRSHWLPFGNFMDNPSRGKVLLIGDAAGFVDPLTGEGIYYAHKTAQLASRAISDFFATQKNADPARSYKNYLQPFLTELRISKRLRNLAYSPLRHLGYVLVKNPKTFQGLAETVHGVRSYTQIPFLSWQFWHIVF